MQVFEATIRTDNTEQLPIGQSLAVRNQRVRIVVLMDEEPDRTEWLQVMNVNPSFAFLQDSEEDSGVLTNRFDVPFLLEQPFSNLVTC